MKEQKKRSSNGFKENWIETKVNYLKYEKPESDKISFPVRFRERYLVQGSIPVTLQGIGIQLQVSAWTERNNVVIRFPLSRWCASKVYDGTISDMGGSAAILSVGRFEDVLRPVVDMSEDSDDSSVIHGVIFVHNYEKGE